MCIRDRLPAASAARNASGNEENEWDHEVSSSVKEGPADCITIHVLAAALKKR